MAHTVYVCSAGSLAGGRMPGDGNKQTQRTALKGAIAGVASRCVIAPLDVVKIRMQVQHHGHPHYTGIANAFSAILREEGPLAFWKGNWSGILLYGAYGACQFKLYAEAQQQLGAFWGGTVAAAAATIATYPLDVTRTRQALRRNGVSAASTRNLFRGVVPTVVQIAPYMGTVFYLHNMLRDSIGDFAAGGLAGLAGKAATMPLDVVRRRLQIAQNAAGDLCYQLRHVPSYSSARECIAYTWLNEGVRGFYKGFALSIAKSVPGAATTFAMYGLLDRLDE